MSKKAAEHHRKASEHHSEAFGTMERQLNTTRAGITRKRRITLILPTVTPPTLAITLSTQQGSYGGARQEVIPPIPDGAYIGTRCKKRGRREFCLPAEDSICPVAPTRRSSRVQVGP